MIVPWSLVLRLALPAVALGAAWLHGFTFASDRAERREREAIEMQQEITRVKNKDNANVTQTYYQAAVKSAARTAALDAELARLRDEFDARAAGNAASSPGADGTPEVVRVISECAGEAARLEAENLRLVDQVRGLQDYARSVCMKNERR